MFEEDRKKEEIRQEEQERKQDFRHIQQMSMIGQMTNAVLEIAEFLIEGTIFETFVCAHF